MSNHKATVVHAGDNQTTWHGAGDDYRVLVTGKETTGEYFIMEASVPPGGGPPPHVQTREEEGFYILEGEIVFHVDEKRIVARRGTFLNVPRHARHHFKNEATEAARMLIFFAPAGIEGLFEAIAAHPENLVSIGKDYGVEYFLS